MIPAIGEQERIHSRVIGPAVGLTTSGFPFGTLLAQPRQICSFI